VSAESEKVKRAEEKQQKIKTERLQREYEQRQKAEVQQPKPYIDPLKTERLQREYEQRQKAEVWRPEEEIVGAFGYRFGEIPDRSNIISQIVSSYPMLLENYYVSPLIKNRGLDTYSVSLCKRTKRIINLSGFKLFDSRDEAMASLEKYKLALENKYGTFNRPTYREANFYKDTLIKHPSSVSVIVFNNSMNPPKWGFMIMYDNFVLARQCGVPGI
jgi:hypothetical protein